MCYAHVFSCIHPHTQAADGSKELLSQMVDGILYIAVHLQPLAVQVIWLKKMKCGNTFPTQFSELIVNCNSSINHCTSIVIFMYVTICMFVLTLGAHAQRGLQYLVCPSVCLSVYAYSRSTGYEAAYKRYQQLQGYESMKIKKAIFLKRLRSRNMA